MRAFLAILLLLAPTARAANLAQDLETIKTGLRIAEMYHREHTVQEALDAMLRKGYAREELLKQPMFGETWQKLRRENSEEMKKIVAKHGWPNVSTFGVAIDAQAYELVSLASHDLAFQEQCLGLLAKALGKRDTHPSHFAKLWDQVKVARGGKQRYGTQGTCTGKGLWEPAPSEDPTRMNQRRRVMGLGSFEEFSRQQSVGCLVAPNT